MPLYGGIDLHANNSVIVLLHEQDEVIHQKRSHSSWVGTRRVALRHVSSSAG
jgi:hypothetical protein